MTKPKTGPKGLPVDIALARQAVAKAKGRGGAWSEYIILHYRATGNLAPGCDAKDFYAVADGFGAWKVGT